MQTKSWDGRLPNRMFQTGVRQWTSLKSSIKRILCQTANKQQSRSSFKHFIVVGIHFLPKKCLFQYVSFPKCTGLGYLYCKKYTTNSVQNSSRRQTSQNQSRSQAKISINYVCNFSCVLQYSPHCLFFESLATDDVSAKGVSSA